MKKIPFSPPDLTDLEIAEVVDTLKSGWITTGPKTKEFEKKLSEYCGTNKTVCLNSWTAAMELALRIIGIGPGDEVITSAYTYTASASIINHVGAKIVLIDTQTDSYEMDYSQLEGKITNKTKAIIPVDIGGLMCDYDKIFEIVHRKKILFNSSDNIFQKSLNRVFVLADAAHSFGATYKGRKNGTIADMTAFSFHAVKNLTTGEGGSITWLPFKGIEDDFIYDQFQLYSLHGQNKDALAKSKPGSWEYDILLPGFKCNMTDIMAAIGLKQLSRYDSMTQRRYEICSMYKQFLSKVNIRFINHLNSENKSSAHLMMCTLLGTSELRRNQIILELANLGISTNVHYKPLPLFTAYKNLGFDIDDFPNAYNNFKSEISLPLNTLLTNDDVKFISNKIEFLLSKKNDL
jgi:dTDP-4-amino-4,6-dideoxygalactose transaminase